MLFLPTLVALRYARFILSLLSICIGYDEIEASTMVEWFHQSRQSLRHIVHEARKHEQRNAANQNQNHHTPIDYFKRIILSLLSNVSRFIFPTPFRIAVHSNKTSVKISFICRCP